MPPAIIAQLVLAALEVWRNHQGKGADWMPTPADWSALRAEVEGATIEKLHADAAARKAARDS